MWTHPILKFSVCCVPTISINTSHRHPGRGLSLTDWVSLHRCLKFITVGGEHPILWITCWMDSQPSSRPRARCWSFWPIFSKASYREPPPKSHRIGSKHNKHNGNGQIAMHVQSGDPMSAATQTPTFHLFGSLLLRYEENTEKSK